MPSVALGFVAIFVLVSFALNFVAHFVVSCSHFAMAFVFNFVAHLFLSSFALNFVTGISDRRRCGCWFAFSRFVDFVVRRRLARDPETINKEEGFRRVPPAGKRIRQNPVIFTPNCVLCC